MKKILFLHGFTSSGSCEIALTLRDRLAGTAAVSAPDLPLHPAEALTLVRDICDYDRPDLIVGSSCGAFYAQQMVRPTGIPAILISPFFRMSEFLAPRIGKHAYKSPRHDGVAEFEVTPALVAEFTDIEQHQFDCYARFDRDRVTGLFGTRDTLAHFRDVFDCYYSTAVDYDGPHTMTADNVAVTLVPLVIDMLERLQPLDNRRFRHFKGNEYRLLYSAKDSETLARTTVYQALYDKRGIWVRPERMFFERVTRDGQTFPRFTEITSE